MSQIKLLSADDVRAIDLSTDQVLSAVEQGLVAQSNGRAIAEPTASFHPIPNRSGLLSVVRGSLPEESLALVKVVGTFPEAGAQGLPSNPGLLMVIDAANGAVTGLIDAAVVTTMRTAAVNAIGARHLARSDSRVLGCIGSRGIAEQSIRYIAELFSLEEIRIFSPNAEHRQNAARKLSVDLNVDVRATDGWEPCLRGADILIEGASLRHHESMFPKSVLSPGTTLLAYGVYSSMPEDVMETIDTVIMDRWIPNDKGETGAFGPQIAAGEITEQSVAAMIGDVIADRLPGRAGPNEAILFWHRGVAACDIALVKLLLEVAKRRGIGQIINM